MITSEGTVHYDHYDKLKYIIHEDVIKYLYELRGKTTPIYRNSYTGKAQAQAP